MAHVCGKPNCRCGEDPPRLHGPCYGWTREIDGTTVTRRLTPDQMARYGEWFENAQPIGALLADLEALSLRVAERDEDWPRAAGGASGAKVSVHARGVWRESSSS